MRNLLRFLLKHFNFILFLILEAVCLVLMINYNNYHKVKVLNSSNVVTAGIYDGYNRVVSYFSLKKVNGQLVEENARLRTLLHMKDVDSETLAQEFYSDSVIAQNVFIPARVINNSTNRQNNYLTLDKGRNEGVEVDMGVVCVEGVVGKVINVSANYATAISLLNKRLRISAKLKKTGDKGSVYWDGKDFRKVVLGEMPFNVNVTLGDTIVTSGFSAIFPENIPIGMVSKIDLDQGSNFYTIQLELFINFNRLSHVNVINNVFREEQKELERGIEND